MTREYTAAQSARQRTRSGGRYSKLNPCELCGKGAGHDYYSGEFSGMTGLGVCLCKRCAKRLEGLDLDGYYTAFGR